MKNHKTSRLKSYNRYVLLQYLTPLPIRSMLCSEVCEPIIEFHCFQYSWTKVLKAREVQTNRNTNS